jgi:hypothetical protein
MAKGVVVCYWGPGHKTSGHLGLAVEADAGKTYITWVPEGTSGEPGLTQALQDDFRVQTGIRDDARNEALALGMGPLRTGQVRTNRLSNTLTKTPTQVAVGTQSYTFNYGQIFRKPDLECEIPAIDATGGTQLGLDVERIYHWWMGFEAATKGVNAQAKAKVAGARAIPWKKVSTTRNCCSVVYRALTIGGASYYRSKWRKSVYLTPPEVFSYAERLCDTIAELNRTNGAIARSMVELGAKLKGLTVSAPNVELPTVAEWVAMSKVKAGLLTGKASRKEQIALIDRALQDYHMAGPWPGDDDYDEDAIQTRDTKAANLCLIIGQASTHAALKPKSDRRHAVAALLTRGWQVLKQRVVGNVNLKLWGDDEIAQKYGFDAFEGMVTHFTDFMTRDDF